MSHKMISKHIVLALASVIAVGITASGWAQTEDIFEKPIRLKAAGEFINVDVGHAAPYVYDFDRDGKRDLLVGQFGQGRLRIYRNIGTDTKPKYETEQWFKTNGEFGAIPSG